MTMYHVMEMFDRHPYTLSRHKSAKAASKAIVDEVRRFNRRPGNQYSYLKRAIWEFDGKRCRPVEEVDEGVFEPVGDWQ